MESRSDWCATDAIRESCQKDMTGEYYTEADKQIEDDY